MQLVSVNCSPAKKEEEEKKFSLAECLLGVEQVLRVLRGLVLSFSGEKCERARSLKKKKKQKKLCIG